MMIQEKSSPCEFAIRNSDEIHGEFGIYYREVLVSVVQKNRNSTSVLKNDLPISDDDVRQIIDMYIFDYNTAIYTLVKHKLRVVKKLEKAVRNVKGLVYEEDLLDLYRRVYFIEDIYR